jgi:YVTN family beta-propeller protein
VGHVSNTSATVPDVVRKLPRPSASYPGAEYVLDWTAILSRAKRDIRDKTNPTDHGLFRLLHLRGHQVFTIDTATNKSLGSVEVGARPWGIALSPDGKTLSSANGPSNDLSVVDVATNAVVTRIPDGASPWGVIALKR